MRDCETSELLEKALQQPGVRDMIRVYGDWRSADQVGQEHCQIIWNTNSSNLYV